ncbi:hypothetical protein [Rhodopseudomonas sp. B29]|uniref:hypothetical protein n=1 Tax=Rhodopseudomonas sp. B29 TaxID=95607 RepID=UPI00034BFDE4|nr:hypothetical protein [Rhodopseudomonas sp. B29]
MTTQQTAPTNNDRHHLSGHNAILRLADDLRITGEGATEADMMRTGWSRAQLARYGEAAAAAARRLARIAN